MLYNAIRPLTLYKNQSSFRPPATDVSNTSGKGNIIFILSPSESDTLALLKDNFFEYKKSFYHYYYIDLVYRKTIGTKRIVENIRNTFPTMFMDESKGTSLKLIHDNAKIRHFEAGYNTIIDLGHWMNIYFKNRRILTPDMLSYNFFSLLEEIITNPLYESYSKIIYVPVDKWVSFKKCDFGTKKECLNDPVSLLLRAIIKKPLILESFNSYTFLVSNEKSGDLLKILGSQLNKKFYGKIKTEISKITSINYQEDEEFELSDILKDEKDNNESVTNKNETINAIASRIKDNLTKDNDIEKNLKEDSEYVEYMKNAGIDSEFENIDSESLIENDDEIFQRVSDRIDELDSDDSEINMNEIEEDIENDLIEDVYLSKIIPQKSTKVQERMAYLQEQQNRVLAQSIEQIKSKTITESDKSDSINSINKHITHVKYANFDSDYINKRYEADIDMAVSALSQGEYPLYIVSKESEDTSTPLTLKKTNIYKLKDENNRIHTLRFDIPLFVDDQDLYINGSKKSIVKQFTLKPIVKTEKDTVQIVSHYRKIFVKKKGDFTDTKLGKVKKYILQHEDRFNLKIGNCSVKNDSNGYRYGNDFAFISRNITSFEIGDDIFLLDIKKLEDILLKKNPKININNIDGNGSVAVGYNKKTKEPIIQKLSSGELFSDIIISRIDDSEKKEILKIKPGSNLCYASMKVIAKEPPVILFLIYCNGLKEVLRITGIPYKIFTKDMKLEYDPLTQDIISFMDGTLVFDTNYIGASMLLNGLKKVKTEAFKIEEMEDKNAILDLFGKFIENRGDAFKLDRIRDFMIDPKTKEILNDFKLPVTLTELLWLACKMLCDNFKLPENCMLQCRIRGAELIQQVLYKQLIDVAYKRYHNSVFKQNPIKVSIKEDEIIKNLLMERTVNAKSSLNPIFEVEEKHAITFRGNGGINLEDAMTFEKRAYDKTMIGVAALSSSPDSNTGVNRQLTMEPNITSLLGYIDITPMEDVDNLSNNNLFSASELLSPPGVRHDDGQRTSMAFKQSKYMVMTEGASPVMIGNKIESVLPYYLSRDFVVVAKHDGKIIDMQEGIYIIQYDDGTYDSFDTSLKTLKNSSAGFFINVKLDTNKKVGDRVKKDEVIACDKKAFTKNKNDRSASMNIGVLAKVALFPTFDGYEDSEPISRRLAEKLAITMTIDQTVTLKAGSDVSNIVKINDTVKTGDPLIIFDESVADPDMKDIIAKFKETYSESTIVSNLTSVKAEHSGTITNIKVFSSVEPEELSPSLKKILNEYHRKLQAKIDILTKYQNENDPAYYKCNTLIDEVPEKIESSNGKIHGEQLDEEVQIQFFISYRDTIKKGDKVANYTALKGISSHVIEKGKEPYSEFRKDEPIDSTILPSAIIARKTPSIIPIMFGNKILIELKRKQKEDYLKD